MPCLTGGMFVAKDILTAKQMAACNNNKQCILLFSHISLYWLVIGLEIEYA